MKICFHKPFAPAILFSDEFGCGLWCQVPKLLHALNPFGQ